ncbi:MAG: hypothetical protein ACI8RT_001521, partial [Candidatus Azotimanducaceae bacterium]
MGLYLAVFLLFFGLPSTLVFMVWLRGGIKSRGDVLDALKVSLKVAAALIGVFFFK